ncbi:RHS repeat-associated core domain-containing protein [Kitasatospora sp. NPDC051853]|uniref:RHS repeat-associated core domain-containing protein n=1 Tax=Kitasatospora sp. NPDC051853 TaxID=3364058 RepID=UPI0037B1C081
MSAALALAVAVSVLAGSETVFAAPAGAAAAAAKGQQQYATSAQDLASARVLARLSGQRVEVLGERTETSTTWVNKDGSLTTELAAAPIRFQRDGQWADVDLTLQQAQDGSVAPKAHPHGLKLGGAGGTPVGSLREAKAGQGQGRPLVTLGSGDQQVELQWRGGLPKPELNGTVATYRNAVADGAADLVVEATRTGFEQFVTLKQRPAADGFSYTMPLKAKGLRAQAQPDGSVVFSDANSGEQRAVMPAPVMWDSTVDPSAGDKVRKAKVQVRVEQRGGDLELVYTPDAAFLADPATRFPVTVDPATAALGNVFDTYVQQGETVDWSTDVELDLGNPGTKNADGSFRTARSFMTWNTAPIADALVSSATLSLWNFHSGNNVDCKPYDWEVWATGRASTASRWTAQPTWNTKYATSNETKGNPSCTSAPDGWVNADVTNLVQIWASAKNGLSDLGLRAASEAGVSGWKRFNSANAGSNVPKLTVNYNYRPRTGTDQQAGSPFFKDAAGTWWVNSATPTLRDTFADPNNDKVNGSFQIFDAATDTQVGNVLVSPWVPSGQPASVTVPAGVLTNGKTYKFRTSPYDGTHYNLGWSPWATFTVDASAPSAPAAVTSADYPSGQWVKGAGQSGVFTVTPPAGDQNGLEWSLDGATWTKVATNGTTTPVNLTVTPDKAGGNTLRVRTTDRAENRSEALSYAFQVGAGGVTSPNDGSRTAARVPLAAEADGSKYDRASFSWRRSDADAWAPVPPADVTNSGAALASWPVALTAGKTPALSWNAAGTVNPDGTVQLRADFTGPGGTVSTEPVKLIVDRKADGAASEDIGPGSVNLLTGDLTVSTTDVSVFGMSVGRTHSSREPNAAAAREGQAPIFGPHWISGISSDISSSDYTEIRKTSSTSLDVVNADGGTTSFTANAADNGWVPQPGEEDLTLRGSFAAGDFTLSDTDGTVTTFTKVDPAAATWTVSSSLLDGLGNTTTTVVSEKVVANGKTLARPKLVIAPSSAVSAAACAADVTTKGCRVLQFGYATATTATGTAYGQTGDFAGQVSGIKLWATAPGAAAATATDVAGYQYDIDGRLRQVWDPRLGRTAETSYAYYVGGSTDGRLYAVNPPGVSGGYHMAYGNVPSSPAAGDGMLTKVWTNTLTPGTASTVNGTANVNVVYGVPLSGAKAPEDLSAATAGRWGQTDLPTDATAVFPADRAPASNNGADLTAGDYGRATVHYLNAPGQRVNQALPGHRITTTEYDRWGNQLRTLAAGNRELALGGTPALQAQLADLGIDTLASADRARLLSSSSTYSADGQRETEALGPLHRVTLEGDVLSGQTVLAKAGTQAMARTRTVKSYDEGRPTDGTAKVKDQATTTVTGGQLRSWPDLFVETRTDKSVYDWAIGEVTQKVEDAGGLNLTTTTGYDTQGRITSTALPASNGSDAGTTRTTYWSATGTGACNGRPEWADLVCRTAPGGDVTGGGTNPVQLPAKTTEYGQFGQVARTDETANGVTTTTVITSDPAGRPVTTTVSGGLGAAVPNTTVTYDPVTGALTKQTSSTGGTITKAYDALGRVISYTDADGGTTTTEYDALNRPTKVTDSVPSTTTYTYDTAIEPRGAVTSVTDSVAGTFTARYDTDGDLATQGLPGGYTLTELQDPAGTVVSRNYTRDSDGTVLVADAVSESVHGQWLGRTGTPGVTASQTFSYDKAGRLTKVQDTSADAICTTRGYGYDRNSNRLTKSTAAAARGQECSGTGATTVTSGYDSADRLTDAGYAYDAFGRTSAMPGSSFSYYTSDLVQQQVAGTNRQTWTLDSAQRLRGWTTEANNAGTWSVTGTKTNHFDGDGDNPRWITEDAAGNLTRNVDGPDGNLGATTTKTGGTVLQLADLHGDIALQLPLDGSAPTVLDYDEYGNPRAGQAASRYGWIGGKQRSSETLTGLTLMGVRLYNPATGRFLSTDPVPGGNANAYDYCSGDPLTCFDLDGRWSWKSISKVVGKTLGRASAIAGVAGLVCVPCRAASAVLGVAAAGVYASGGHYSAAGRQLRSTAISVATGGFGRFRAVTGLAGRYNRATRSWRGGIASHIKRSRAAYPKKSGRYRFHTYSGWAIKGGGQYISKYEYVHYGWWRRPIDRARSRFHR